MERRLSSRLARAADRRDARLLRRLREVAAHGHRACAGVRFCLSGRSLRASRRTAARRAQRRACARSPSSISCRTTTRSAIARSATGLKASRADSAIEAALAITLLAPMPPDAVHGRGMGIDRSRSRSSAISRAISPTRCARAGARNSPAPTPNMATRFPIRWPRRRSDPPCWTGMRATGRQAPAAGAGAGSARDPPRRKSCRGLPARRFGEAQLRGNGLLTAQLAHGRRRDACTCSPICPTRDRRASRHRQRTRRSGAASCRTPLPPWSVHLAHRRAIMPPAIPIATYRLQLTADFGFDAAAARRALSEGARHHAISMPRPS